jgi:hypothetical protein
MLKKDLAMSQRAGRIASALKCAKKFSRPPDEAVDDELDDRSRPDNEI